MRTKITSNSNEIRKSVNKFDKSFFINIKDTNELNEPELVFESYLNIFKNYLVDRIYEMHMVKIPDNLTLNQKIDYIENDEFKNKSHINFDKTYLDDNYNFKCRFLAVFLKMYLDKVKKLSINRYKYLNNNSPAKYENSYFQLKRVVSDTITFINVFKSGKSYKNIMLQMNQNCSFITTKKSNPIVINNHIINIIQELEMGIPTNFSSMKMSEDLAIDSILKLTYMLTTGKTDLDVLPEFKYIESACTSYDLGQLIKALGIAIQKSNNKKSIMFRAYIESHPSIFIKRNCENDESLIIGIYALSYTKFFCNNKNISKYINKMIESRDII